MTVSTTSYLIQYAGTGSTTDFATGFEFIADTDLVVILTDSSGVDTTQVLTTNYTVAGAGNDAGGTVTMLVAPASGETLTIYRSTALTQATDYTEGDPFPAETHEQALDKLTLIAQEVSGGRDRTLKFKETEDRSGGTKNSDVPSPVEGKVLGWDADGNLVNITLGSVTYDIVISGGDAGKVVVVNSTEDGIETGELPVSSAATASTIASRDASGRIKAADPSAAQDVATKNWLENTYEAQTANIADDAITAAKVASSLPIPHLLSTTAITNVSTIDLATAFSANSGYRYFAIVVEDCVPTTGGQSLALRVSIDGSAFRSTAGDYDWIYQTLASNAANPNEANSTSDTEILLGEARLATHVGGWVIRFDNPHDGSNQTSMTFDGHSAVSTTKAARERGVGGFLATTDDVTGFQLLWDGGDTFASGGSIKIYGSNYPI